MLALMRSYLYCLALYHVCHISRLIQPHSCVQTRE